jgi:hypothetical protein
MSLGFSDDFFGMESFFLQGFDYFLVSSLLSCFDGFLNNFKLFLGFFMLLLSFFDRFFGVMRDVFKNYLLFRRRFFVYYNDFPMPSNVSKDHVLDGMLPPSMSMAMTSVDMSNDFRCNTSMFVDSFPQMIDLSFQMFDKLMCFESVDTDVLEDPLVSVDSTL